MEKRLEEFLKPCPPSCEHSFCVKTLFSETFLKDPIGQGTFSKVYKLTDPETKTDIAVKKFEMKFKVGDKEAEYLENNINKYRDTIFHERIIRYYASYIQDNIIQDKNIYIFMEFAQKESLQTEIKKNGSLKHSKIIRYSRQVLEGLEFLHKNHIIHRDVKPPNILMFPNDCIKLCDFGLSRVIESISDSRNKGGANTFAGTPNYMAPELISADKYGFSVDIWSLGASIVEMLTGTPPYSDLQPTQFIFRLGSTKKIEYTPKETMSDQFKDFLDNKVLAPNPEERPSATQLLELIIDMDKLL